MLYIGLGIFMRKGDLTFCMSGIHMGWSMFSCFFFFSFFRLGKERQLIVFGW